MSSICCDLLLTRLGSCFPTAGTSEANASWKGGATNKPVSSNHWLKGRSNVSSSGLASSWVPTVMTLTL